MIVAVVFCVLYLALCIGAMAALNLSLPVPVVIGVLLFLCALYGASDAIDLPYSKLRPRCERQD